MFDEFGLNKHVSTLQSKYDTRTVCTRTVPRIGFCAANTDSSGMEYAHTYSTIESKCQNWHHERKLALTKTVELTQNRPMVQHKNSPFR